MENDFWDINSLTISELGEIIHLKKARSLTDLEAMQIWMRENPGRIKHLGSVDKNNEFVVNEISENGVKEITGMEALSKIIKTVLKDKDGNNAK